MTFLRRDWAAIVLALGFALPSIPGQARPWRFAYMSDHRSSQGHHPGVSTTTVSRLAADILTNGVDLLLIGGDLIHGDGQPTSGLIEQYDVFKNYLTPLTNAGIACYAIPGNHEFWSESNSWSQVTGAWWQAFGQFLPQNGPTSPCPERGMTYSFNHKSALFLGVNLYTSGVSSWSYKGADTNWVQTQLAGNTKPHVFVFGHVPQTSLAGTSSNAQNVIAFWNLLANARCSAYFCGHSHSYQRILTRAPNGAGYIFQVMDGSGMDAINPSPAPPWPAGNPIAVEQLCADDTMRGYVLVEVDGLNVSMTRRCFYTNGANAVFWTNMDSFAYTANPGSNWSFAVFGDTRGDGSNWPSNPCINTAVIEAICAAVTNDGALCAIVPGDLQHGQHAGGVNTNTIAGQLALWTNAVSALDRAGIPYYAVRGNHETYRIAGESDPAHADWMKHIGNYLPSNGPTGELGMTFSVPFGNALFVGLDTYHGTNDSGSYHQINQDWLELQLAGNAQPHLFVFGHEPAVRAGISCLSAKLSQRNRFWDAIGYANGRAYLTGHSHIYARCLLSISNGPALRQLIVGTGGGPLNYTWDGQYQEPAGSGATIVPEASYNAANTYGYTLVRVSGNHVAMEYRSSSNLTTWTTNDLFQYTLAAQPTNLQATHGDYADQVLVWWNPNADASGYEVWRGTNADATGRAQLGFSAGASFADTEAVPLTYYYYWVRATNSGGYSLFSAVASGWRNTNGGLPAPAGVAATQGAYTNKVRVTWQPVAGALLYDVYRGLLNDPNASALIAAGLNVELYDDGGTAPGQTNFYWVKARNGGNVSGFSGVAAGYRGVNAYLPAPAAVSASDGVYTDKVAVAWSAVAAASEYEVWRAPTNHSSLATRFAVLVATQYDDVAAAQSPGVSFYYWIKARNTAATSDFSIAASGYCAPGGGGDSADIYLEDFVLKPAGLRPFAHPAAVSVNLGNHGAANLASPNTRVVFDFYLSADQTLHDEIDLWIGDYQTDVQLPAGSTTRIILAAAARAALRIPEVPAGTYYVFAHVRHAAPSTLTDPVPENNTAMRVGTVVVGPDVAVGCGLLNDFDGDAKTDPAVYEAVSGKWQVLLSGSGYALATQSFGGTESTPLSGDYDGDGQTDLMLYQAGVGLWGVLLSGSGYALATMSFGGAGYTPLSGDYDGDGKTDLMLYQAGTGLWGVLLSGNGYVLTTMSFGDASCVPVAGDYDGDGKTDLMLYQAGTGLWGVLLSGSGYALATQTFSAAGCVPVAGDYDGDGKTDLMLYQEATGGWGALLSGSGYALVTVPLGGPGCTPLP
jgi:hypothetical protein